MENPDSIRAGWYFSAALHLTLALLIVFGLPELFKHKAPEEMPIAVKLINLADLTRATQRNPTPKADAPLDTPPAPTPPPPKPEPPKPEPPKPAEAPPPPPPPPPPKPEPPRPDAPKPADAKPLPPMPEPPKAPRQVVEAPPPKPEPPKPEPSKPEPPKVQPKPEPKKQDVAFDQLLKNLTTKPVVAPTPDKQPAKPQPAAPQQQASAQPNAPLGSKLTTNELDTLRQQFERCWSPPAGARDARDLRVEIRIEVGQDGTVSTARIADQARLASDPFWRTAAESALRAVKNPACAKLELPPGKYDDWKSITLFFDPKDLL